MKSEIICSCSRQIANTDVVIYLIVVREIMYFLVETLADCKIYSLPLSNVANSAPIPPRLSVTNTGS